MHSEESRWSSEQGFGFIETLISIAVLTAVSVGVAQLFAVAALANHNAEANTSTAVLAIDKMEQLRALAWGFESLADGELGLPVSDSTTDVSVFPQAAGGPGLLPSPSGTLDGNVPFYVDYLDANGDWLGTGGAAPPPRRRPSQRSRRRTGNRPTNPVRLSTKRRGAAGSARYASPKSAPS